MSNNEALIARVREALKYDLHELDEVFTPLLNDVLAELTRAPTEVFLMVKGEESAVTRMESNPLPCIADAYVVGDRANFKVRDIVTRVDSCGFLVSDNVGWRSIHTIAKVIMLHTTRVIGVTSSRVYEYEHGVMVDFNRELTADELTKLTAFLGK